MDLTHRFSVPARRDEAWNAFTHLERLAPCFPGATLTPAGGNHFTGSVKVKLGPVALVYEGTGRYLSRDPEAGELVIEAAGKDKRGLGTASLRVSIGLAEDGERTQVETITQLSLTGRPTQFGDAVVADVADRLVAQFVDCISVRFADGLGAPEPEPLVEDSIVDEPPVELGTAPEELDGPATDIPPINDPRPEAAPTESDFATVPGSPTAATPPRPHGAYLYTPPSDSAQTHLSVLSNLAPLALKLWPAVAAALVTFAVLNRILKRRHR